MSSCLPSWRRRFVIVDEAFDLLDRHRLSCNDFTVVGDFLDKLGLVSGCCDLIRLLRRYLGPCYDLSVAHDVIQVAILASSLLVNGC